MRTFIHLTNILLTICQALCSTLENKDKSHVLYFEMFLQEKCSIVLHYINSKMHYFLYITLLKSDCNQTEITYHYDQWYVIFKSAVLIFSNYMEITTYDVTDDTLDLMADICTALLLVPFLDQHVAPFGAEY